MAIAYLVGTPFSNPLSWANASGGVAGSFGGIPASADSIIIDANSVNAIADISSKIGSISKANAGVTITQTSDLDTDSFTISQGTWTTGAFGFNCTNVFNQSGGTFTGISATSFLVGGLNLTGGSMTGTPSLPSIIQDPEDTIPDTVEDAILQTALNPKRVKGDMGEVEMHNIDDLIKADKYVQGKKAVKAGIGSMLKQIKPSGTV